MSQACFNFSSPEFKNQVEALKTRGFTNPFFYAVKDYMMYNEFRNPDEVYNTFKEELFGTYTPELIKSPLKINEELVQLIDKEKDNLQNTIEYELLTNQEDEKFEFKGGQSYVFLNSKDAARFAYILDKEKAFPNEFKVTKIITKYERTGQEFQGYNEYVDLIYIKANKNKKSNLYNILDKNKEEVLATNVRVLHTTKDVKSDIASKYGLEYTPTKIFNANRSIAFVLYREKPSKAKYVAQAKKYLYDAIKFLNPEETSLKINLDEIGKMLELFPNDMWDYINTTYSPEDSTNVNASITLQNSVKFKLPKLGLLTEIEKITGKKLQGVSFKNYDRTGGVKKVLRVEWGENVVIDHTSMTTKQLRKAIAYYLNSTGYFKPSSEEENVRKYAEHNNIDYNELQKLVFGDFDYALENISYNWTGNSDTIELSKWRESIRQYNWQTVELFAKPYEEFLKTAKERITKKFKDKKLSNGISHLDYFFSGNFNWLNINFNNISGQYYMSDMETEADTGFDVKIVGFANPFELKTYKKPKPVKNFLKEEEVFNRLAAILHEPFHALHALSYGTEEELDLRKAFDSLYNTAFGKEMMDQVFGSGYNKGGELSYDTLYKEFTAFSTQLMLYPKQWIQKTDLRSNDIFEFIEKVQTLQDKTYEEIVKTREKIGETEVVVDVIENIKLNFLEKLYNYIVKALNNIIPLSENFFKVIEDSKLISKSIIKPVFGEIETTVVKTEKLPENIKKSKEEFLEAMENLKSAISTLMQIDSKLFSSENVTNFFSDKSYKQDSQKFKKLINESAIGFLPKKDVLEPKDLVSEITEDEDLIAIQELMFPGLRNKNLYSLFDIQGNDNVKALGELEQLANRLTEQLNVPYEFLTDEEAKELLGDKYLAQKSFFYNGVVYFNKDQFTTATVFHEFSHALVEALSVYNPELFNKLVNQALASTIQLDNGQMTTVEQMVIEEYPELDKDSMGFKKEVLTWSLGKAAELVNTDKKGSLLEWLKEFMYQVKQLLRNIFGSKIDISKLNVNTTIDDLAKSLAKGDYFIITAEDITNKEIQEFREENRKVIKNINEKFDNEKLVVNIKELSSRVNKFVDRLALPGYNIPGVSRTTIKDLFATINGKSLFEEVQSKLGATGKKLQGTLNEIKQMERSEEITDVINDLEKRLTESINDDTNPISIYEDIIGFLKGRDVLTDDQANKYIDLIREADQEVKIEIESKFANFKADYNFFVNQATNLVETIEVLDTALDNMIEDLNDTLNNINDKNLLKRAHTQNDIINYWLDYIQGMKKDIESGEYTNGLIPNDLVSFLSLVETKLKSAKHITNKIYKKSTTALVVEQLESLDEYIREYYDNLIQKLEDKKMPEWLIQRTKDKYKQSSIRNFNTDTGQFESLEKSIEMYLEGKLGDSHALNGFLEGYMYNQDPIVMSVAKFIKDNYNRTVAEAQSRMEAWWNDISPLAKKLGYNPSNPQEFTNKVAFQDEISYYDTDIKEGPKYVIKKVWRLLNPNKNWESVLFQKREDLKKLEATYNDTLSVEDEAAFMEAADEFEKWQRKYFYQPFKDEFYKFKSDFFSDAIGKIANNKLKYYQDRINESKAIGDTALAEKYRKLSNQLYSLTDTNGNTKKGDAYDIAQKLIEYREQSKKFYTKSIRTKAFNRNFYQKKQEIRDWVTKTYKDKAQQDIEFNKRWNEFLLTETTVVLNTEYWESIRNINERIKLLNAEIRAIDKANEEYYAQWDELTKERDKLLLGKKDSSRQYDPSQFTEDEVKRLEEITNEIDRLDKEVKVRESGLTQAEWDRYQIGINKDQYTIEELKEAFDIPADFPEMSVDTRVELEVRELRDKAKRQRLDTTLFDDLKSAKEEKRNLQKAVASDYYIDNFNDQLNLLRQRNPQVVIDYFNGFNLSNYDISSLASVDDSYLSKARIEPLLEDAEFKEWFDKTHKVGYKGDYQRMYLYNKFLPKDITYYESYTAKNPEDVTDQEEIIVNGIPRVPNENYVYRTVKDEYRNKEIIGVTTTNKGQWLPKNREDMRDYYDKYKDDFEGGEDPYQFINEKYYEVIDSGNTDLIDVIEKLKWQALDLQNGVSKYGRLYLDLPRFYSSKLEILRNKKMSAKDNPISRLVKRVREFLLSTKKIYSEGLNNFEEQARLVNLDMMDDEISGVKIAGSDFIDIEDVNTDIVNNYMRYMLSAIRQKNLIQMYPDVMAVKQSLINVDGTPVGVDDRQKIDKKSWIENRIRPLSPLRFLKKKNENNRLNAINNLIEREFQGISQKGIGSKENVRLNKLSQLIFGRASFGFFAFNVPSAIKNYLGQKWQYSLHAIGGGDYDLKDMASGQALAFKTATEVTLKMYGDKEKSVYLDLADIMDAAQGRVDKNFGRRFSRSFVKDVAELANPMKAGISYNTREWLQLLGQYEVFFSALEGVKLNQLDADGNATTISYTDAWEKRSVTSLVYNRDGSTEEVERTETVLKDGIDPEYDRRPRIVTFSKTTSLEEYANKFGITQEELERRISKYNNGKTFSQFKDGEDMKVADMKKFNTFVNRQHDLQNKLGGAYAPWEQPEAQRFLLFRLVSYLRRYFTRMFMYRFQYKGHIWKSSERFNIGAERLEMGWYIKAMNDMLTIILTKGKYLSVMSTKDKLSMMRVLTEFVALTSLTMLLPLVFGFDDDDDDKYDKLREKSGHLPFLFAPGDEDHPFNMFGWLSNHALLMTLQVRKENEAFIPLPGYGLEDYKDLANLSSIAYGPTIETYVKMAGSIFDLATRDKSAYYKRDSGPYLWQREGGIKAFRYGATALGLTGSTLDPIMGIKTQYSIMSRE